MTGHMTRSDRAWTAVLAECALDRARPLLAAMLPDPFARVDLAHALRQTGLIPDRETGFASVLWPSVADALGDDAAAMQAALAALPFDFSPATALWRSLLRDLHGENRPALTDDDALHWAAFVNAFRGRTPTFAAPWLQQIADATKTHRDLMTLADKARAAPLTALDRSIYLRFGWNDDGQIPGLNGLLNAAALLRTRQAWTLAAPQFDATAQAKILAAAQHMVTMGRIAAMSDLSADVQRYGVNRAALSAALYPVRVVPPLLTLLAEAA